MLTFNEKSVVERLISSSDNADGTLSELLDSVNDAFLQWDTKKKIIYWSSQALTLLGSSIKSKEQPQSEFLSIVYLKTLPALLAAVEEAPSAKETKKIEISIQSPNGDIRWFEMAVLPGRIQSDVPHLILGTIRDIQSPKMLEQELSNTNYMLDEASRIANLGAWEYDILDKRMTWSKQLYKIHDVPVDFAPTLSNVLDFYVDSSKLLFEKSFQQLLADGTPFDKELQMHTHTGNSLWVRAKCEPLYNDNKLVKVRGFIQDITNEKEYKELLQKHDSLFYSAFQFAPYAKAIVFPDQVRANEKLKDLLGYPKDFYQSNYFDSITVGEDLRKEKVSRQVYETGEADLYTIDKRIVHKDGHHVWVRFTRSRIKNASNEVLYEIVHMYDIDGQRKAELQKKLKMDMLTVQNNQLNNFAHIVSHNLRSHSGNLEMLCYLYDEESDEGEREHLVDNIKKISEGLSTTIGHLAEIVKATQTANHKVKNISFEQVLGRTMNVLEGQISQTKALIEADFTDGPDIEYPAAYMDSIFLNLISNAIKYRDPNRTPLIKLKTFCKGDRVILSVQDNGVGIDMEKHRKKLFGLYKTFHDNENAQGVGLFLTKNQVEAMGGRISVNSKVGEGSKFTVMF